MWSIKTESEWRCIDGMRNIYIFIIRTNFKVPILCPFSGSWFVWFFFWIPNQQHSDTLNLKGIIIHISGLPKHLHHLELFFLFFYFISVQLLKRDVRCFPMVPH